MTGASQIVRHDLPHEGLVFDNENPMRPPAPLDQVA
jgi:hypothetical protein